MITTEELIKVALLPKPITVEIKGIAEKCIALIQNVFRGDEEVCIYNHFTNTFDKVTDSTIIQTRYPVLVFKVKETKGKKARTYCFFSPSNMPFSVEGETAPDFWKNTFDLRFGEPVELTYTLVEHNNFNYLDFEQDPEYTEAMKHYLVDNEYALHLMSFVNFKYKRFISKNIYEFKVFSPRVLKTNAHKFGYIVQPYNPYTQGCNRARLTCLVGSSKKVYGGYDISTINLGLIENKINRVEDDIALLRTDQEVDNVPRLLTLGDFIKIEMCYLLCTPPCNREFINFNDMRSLTFQCLSYLYIYESFMLGCKPVKNLKASTVYAMLQLKRSFSGHNTNPIMPDLNECTFKVGKDGKAPLQYSENLDIKLLDFIKCLDDCIAVHKPNKPYLEYTYCEAIYNKAIKKIQSVDELVDLFFL